MIKLIKKGGIKDMKKTAPIREKHSRMETGNTEHAPHGSPYFVMGNNKIIIREHFSDDGKPLKSILEKVILDAGKQPRKTA